jgi:hypothetical protein
MDQEIRESINENQNLDKKVKKAVTEKNNIEVEIIKRDILNMYEALGSYKKSSEDFMQEINSNKAIILKSIENINKNEAENKIVLNSYVEKINSFENKLDTFINNKLFAMNDTIEMLQKNITKITNDIIKLRMEVNTKLANIK